MKYGKTFNLPLNSLHHFCSIENDFEISADRFELKNMLVKRFKA